MKISSSKGDLSLQTKPPTVRVNAPASAFPEKGNQVFSVSEKELSRFREAAQEFESMFLNLVIGSMRQTVVKGGLVDGGHAEEIYQSMLDMEYSKSLAQQRMTGLAEALERQLIDRKLLGKDADFAANKHQALNAYQRKKLP